MAVATTKKWWLSKTLWVNFVAFIALVVQLATGSEWFNPYIQGMVIVAINKLLRTITKEEIVW